MMLEKRFGRRIGKIVEAHHEREDGSGYPYGLNGDDIIFEAKIIAVVDSFDAMTSRRTYSQPISFEQAIRDLETKPNLYNQEIVKVLRTLVENGTIKKTTSLL
jgi:HD-GYP domain-containing protein (c-di-GMP phosphodiesterase class II)